MVEKSEGGIEKYFVENVWKIEKVIIPLPPRFGR